MLGWELGPPGEETLEGGRAVPTRLLGSRHLLCALGLGPLDQPGPQGERD